MPGTSGPLAFRALDAHLVATIEPWFDDEETRQYLGGRDWIRRELRLIADMPGRTDGDVVIVGRWGWVVFDDDEPVGFSGVERYGDGTVSASFLVAPDARRRGIGRRLLWELRSQPELAGIVRFVGGVEPENVASRRCLAAIGITVADEVNVEGCSA